MAATGRNIFEEAKAILLSDIERFFPDGERRQDGWWWRRRSDDTTPSCHVVPGSAACVDFGDPSFKGSVLDCWAALHGMSAKDAAEEIVRQAGGKPPREEPTGKKKEQTAWVIPVPGDRENELHEAPKAAWCIERYGDLAGSWDYRDAEGCLLYVRARFNRDGAKQIIPFGWTVEGSAAGDPFKGKLAPLYRLPALAAAGPAAAVLLVEGERCADVAAQYMREAGMNVVAMTWPGGAKAKKQGIAWGPLRGRKVYLWPDKDEAGALAMKEIAEVLR